MKRRLGILLIAVLSAIEIGLVFTLFAGIPHDSPSHASAFAASFNNPTPENEARWKVEHKRYMRVEYTFVTITVALILFIGWLIFINIRQLRRQRLSLAR